MATAEWGLFEWGAAEWGSAEAGAPVVFRDARIPIAAGGAVEVFRDARLPIAAGASLFRDARIPVYARGNAMVSRDARIPIAARGQIFRDARIPIYTRRHDAPIQRYTWRVLQAADAVQVYAWAVVEISIVGGQQHYRWRVFAEPPTQGYAWSVIPAELLELFASKGAGAAAGIAPDTLLPVGRVTKD